MSNLKVNTINDASGGSAAVLYGVASPPNSMGFRNRLINSDMRIDQRNAGASVNPTAGNTAYIVDRWGIFVSQSSKLTAQQNAGAVTPPVGFTNYLGVTSSSAYSVISTDGFTVFQRIEGLNVSDLGWGSANAQAVTLSFWVRSSLTGMFAGNVTNSAGNRAYPFSYTISAANTWEQKTVTIPGDTTGTWLTTNGIGISLGFSMGTGSANLGTAGVWNAGTAFGVTGQTNLVGTSGATFYITGVQLEAGTVASPFERRDYGRELMMCQRYYQFVGGNASAFPLIQGYTTAGNTLAVTCLFPVQMRSSPTAVLSGTWALSNATNLRADFQNQQGFSFRADAVVTGVLNAYPNSTDDVITFAAEL